RPLAQRDAVAAHRALDDPDDRVRATALATLVHAGDEPEVTRAAWLAAVDDTSVAVRRRAAELAPTVRSADAAHAVPALVRLVDACVGDAEHRTTTSEMDAHCQHVLRELGRRPGQGLVHRTEDGLNRLVDRLARLLRPEHDRLRPTAHEVAATNLGLVLVPGR